MKDYRLSPQAYQDIDEIWEFIARDNLDAADRVRDRIFEAFNLVQHAWDIWVTHIVLLIRERRPHAVISRLNSALRILKSSNTHAFRQLF